VFATKEPEINARSSTLPLTCVLMPISDVKEKELESSQSVKGCPRGDVRGAVGSHLRCKRLKSPARKADRKRFRGSS
jgi:hypothetical protein